MSKFTKKEYWAELFEMWLKSIGATVTITKIRYDCGKFTYHDVGHRWGFYEPYDTLKIDVGYNHMWADIDLDITNVDIQAPSFDPDVFFEPFKEWLQKNAADRKLLEPKSLWRDIEEDK